ncbi:Isoamyl acetate-hydrolyzing esterase 1 [Phytophthora cinnamomi]|uniref:Isoamyl acetate-hydrolyzing esterase 1 n=1 Tax=Phytophthora cinnamomi TaxID=4785 RepID=UPI0035595E0B|nr:Isoamyl acetate-hydrolyzing esterase 1 [Phytophthora cinnamomi]
MGLAASTDRRPVFYFIGDSITEQANDPDKSGFITLLQQHYVRSVDTINRGLSGYNTKWVLQHGMPIFSKELQYHSPRFLLTAQPQLNASLAWQCWRLVYCRSMPRGTKLTEEEHHRITAFSEAGLSERAIVTRVQRSRPVVHAFLSDPEGYTKAKRSERPKKLTPKAPRRLLRDASKGQLSSAELKMALELSRKASSVLTKKHKEARLTWARAKANASIHTSGATKEFLKEENVDVMDWPAKSPDLNPIENMWGVLARAVYAHGRQFQTREDLIETIKASWAAIGQDLITKLVESMPKRCIATLELHGAKTKY